MNKVWNVSITMGYYTLSIIIWSYDFAKHFLSRSGCVTWMRKCQRKYIVLCSNRDKHAGSPHHLDSTHGTVSTQKDLQTSGSSSEPSGQSFSRSQRQPLEMHVTPSLHTNCLGLQVFGAEKRQRKSRLIKRFLFFLCQWTLFWRSH